MHLAGIYGCERLFKKLKKAKKKVPEHNVEKCGTNQLRK